MPKRILITGIPGTGKTTIGTLLENEHGFDHYDFEDLPTLYEFLPSPPIFMQKLLNGEEDIVITWGFVPESQTGLVCLLKDAGFDLIWFDGDRVAARKAYLKRGSPLEAFDIQLANIEKFEVIKTINPIIYNSFKENGEFKPQRTIIKEIIEM